jgi:paraquat-inducible protein B
MSIRANPTAIGAFIIGGIALSIAGASILASATWFQQRSTFVSFFSESVNGLEAGAPVKFQGVPVGTVEELLIQINRTDKTFQVPVTYEVDLSKLITLSGAFVDLSAPGELDRQIAEGLRARLQMESIVTGQLYIELSYDTAAAPPVLEPHLTKFPEIPTTPSLMAALGTGAGSVVADVMKVLFSVNTLLDEIDMPAINAAVVGTSQSVQRLADAPELHAALKQLPAITAQVSRSMVAVESLAVTANDAVGPIGKQVEQATTELASALQVMRKTLQDAQGLISTDSGIGFEIQAVLASLKSAADALQLLTTTLEQSPDILLRGKKPPGK